MTSSEQANRTADLVLELVQARRQLTAVRALADAMRTPDPWWMVPRQEIAKAIDEALKPKPAPSEGHSSVRG